MSLTQEKIKKLSENLSKISLNSWKMWQDINGILKYMDLLNEIDTKWVVPTINVSSKNNELRDDILEKKFKKEDLLNCSEQKVISEQIAISNIMK